MSKKSKRIPFKSDEIREIEESISQLRMQQQKAKDQKQKQQISAMISVQQQTLNFFMENRE